MKKSSPQPDPHPTRSDLASRLIVDILQDRAGREILESQNWSALVDAASDQGLAGLLYNALRKQGLANIDGPVPASEMARLEKQYRSIQVANITLREELRSVLRVLAAADIPVIVLKGGVLSELVYGDVGLRPMQDLDLLVRCEDASKAVALLHAAGYRRGSKPELRPGFDSQFRVEAELIAPGPYSSWVEIHWLLLAPLFACRHVDHAAVWERAGAVTLVGQHAFTLGPEDWVLHQAAHALYKHRTIGLKDLVDVDRLIRFLGPQLDWEKLLEIGKAFHWLPALAAVLPACVELLGTPVPSRVVQVAVRYQLPKYDQWMLDWWLAPGRPERHHVFPDWLSLPGWGRRAAVLWAYLFPDRAYLNSCYSQHAAAPLPLLHLRRWWSGINIKNL